MNQLVERVNKLSPEKRAQLVRQLKLKSGNFVSSGSLAPSIPRKRPFRPAEDHNFRLEVGKPGLLDTLTFRACPRTPPEPDEVEIEVCAASLNFKDVVIALGDYPVLTAVEMPPLGANCAGRISAVGCQVSEFKIGDEVLALAVGSFGAFAKPIADCTLHKPRSLSFAEAATIPLVFLTAYAALHEFGQLSEGERVLIHSAAGGVGLAAIQVARWKKAEIYASAGTPQKREYLRTLGVRHIIDSRSPAFADVVLELTGGEGVDVILNSLPGEAIPKGLEILRPFGRFLEIGRKDIFQNNQLGLFPFRKGISFSVVDVSFFSPELRPGFVYRIFHEIMARFEDRTFLPVPTRIFPFSEATLAFEYMTRGNHIGKIVLVRDKSEVLVEPVTS